MSQEMDGKVKKVTGQVKEAAGILTGNEKLEQKGAAERAEGAVEESLGKARRKVGELVDAVAKAIKE
ncbi:MAG: CsbD family protein [Thermoanaerobaculia bacterium]|jgi:uncharacterized protein YjbJ (UPF0337 family)|nr:CsbD family protein [Thermoanaerobaculia bacterium]MBP9822955.1 CsbD family protein [Thermoanaerobaculia bacterium]